MHQIYFTPGPSALYYTVEGHLKTALKDQVPSISHRSKAFESIYARTTENLRQLLNIPTDYEIFFTASATEVWERLMQNCVDKSSLHLVNGAFSNRFYEIAKQLGKQAIAVNAPDGDCVDVSNLEVPDEVELIAATQNETSTGVAHPLKELYDLKDKNPEKLLAVDLVSAYPFIDYNLNKLDATYFSVQKGFGLPAGLGVWILNKRCVEKANELSNNGKVVGSYHTINALIAKGKKNQTPETPNVLGIYLLGKVAEDMLTKGIQQIRNETIYKSVITYNLLQNHPLLSPLVPREKHQSKTVIVAKSSVDSSVILDHLGEKGMILGSGYGKYKNDHIRIANFPTHSKEQFEMLVDTLEAFVG